MTVPVISCLPPAPYCTRRCGGILLLLPASHYCTRVRGGVEVDILLLLPHIVPGGTTATTTTAYLTLHHQVLRNGFQGGDQLIKACTCVRLHFPTRRPLRWDCPSVPAWDNKEEFCLIAVSWFLDWCCKTVIAIVQALHTGLSATIECNRCQSLSLIASL